MNDQEQVGACRLRSICLSDHLLLQARRGASTGCHSDRSRHETGNWSRTTFAVHLVASASHTGHESIRWRFSVKGQDVVHVHVEILRSRAVKIDIFTRWTQRALPRRPPLQAFKFYDVAIILSNNILYITITVSIVSLVHEMKNISNLFLFGWNYFNRHYFKVLAGDSTPCTKRCSNVWIFWFKSMDSISKLTNYKVIKIATERENRGIFIETKKTSTCWG
jgi:hypothetical protein